MTLAQLLGFVLICSMIAMVYFATKHVAGIRYRGHGVYFIMVNGFLRRNCIYLDWLKENKYVVCCVLLIASLCPMILTLIEPFRNNKMFMRPESTLYINLILWLSILFRDKWLYRKLEDKE